MVLILDHDVLVLENGCSSFVIIDHFWVGSFAYRRPIGIWSFVYQLIGIWSFIYVCLQRSAAFISRLSTSETDRNPFHIFTHWKSNEIIIAVSGDFLWNILLSSFLKVFGVKDHDGDQPVCLKCNSFSIAPNTKCSWVLWRWTPTCTSCHDKIFSDLCPAMQRHEITQIFVIYSDNEW